MNILIYIMAGEKDLDILLGELYFKPYILGVKLNKTLYLQRYQIKSFLRRLQIKFYNIISFK